MKSFYCRCPKKFSTHDQPILKLKSANMVTGTPQLIVGIVRPKTRLTVSTPKDACIHYYHIPGRPLDALLFLLACSCSSP